MPAVMPTPSNQIHADLRMTRDLLYHPSLVLCSEPIKEAEGSEYGAYTFEMGGRAIRYRVAKTTPTKIGQFVTLWKRIAKGPIQPFDLSDPVDLFVITTRQGKKFGQFVFPKSVLCQRNIVSSDGKGGKRAIRVYPPWEKTTSKQARKTQEWQISYFLEIPIEGSIDWIRFRTLYFVE